MKEIDFLPDWYKEGRRRQISVRRQYMALAGIFLVMITYNLVATRMISKAAVELSEREPIKAEAQNTLYELDKVRGEIAQLEKKANVLHSMDSKVDLAAVLAEMSYLIDKRIVLRRVELVAEQFEHESTDNKNAAVVRVAGTGAASHQQAPYGDVRFRVMISGVAADSSRVAALICLLEDSPYFTRVYPSFSRNTQLQIGSVSTQAGTGDTVSPVPLAPAPETVEASEFEISCYLANHDQVNG